MRVAFIGAGSMATAIAKGAHAADASGWDFVFASASGKTAETLAHQVEGQALPLGSQTLKDAIANADLVVLAVKPQVQAEVLKDLPATDAALVSIAAGRTLERIEADLEGTSNANAAVIRVMPNVNASVGQSASAICANENANSDQVDAAELLFASVGTVVELPETLFPVFTAMAGSSPAWFFVIADHLADGGVKHGLTRDHAIRAVAQSMAGSASLLIDALDRGENAAALTASVCSPGGTTIAGLLAAEEAGLGPSLIAAVDATVRRDSELDQ